MHPYLAPVALVMARWLGREGFHGGGIVAGGGVWGVLGDKTAGKSTTLAWLAREGVGVVSDDVLVIDGGTALAGPRSVDLREEAAERLGVGEPMGRVGQRERWRFSAAAGRRRSCRCMAGSRSNGAMTSRSSRSAAPSGSRRCCRIAACACRRSIRRCSSASARFRICGSSARATGTPCPAAAERLLGAIAIQGESRISST